MMLMIAWGKHWSPCATKVLGYGIGEALRDGMGRGMLRKEPDSMRATQFVRRGLIAFATVATLSAGFAGVTSAQQSVIDGDDAIVWMPIPGYTYDVIHVNGERSALLAVGGAGANFPVAVRFLPDFDGAAIMNIVTPDVIAERQ